MLKTNQILTELGKYPELDFDKKTLKNWTIVSNTSNKSLSKEQQYFMLVKDDSYPALIELKVGRDLNKLLVEKYESVSPAKNIDPANWSQIICSGQLTDQDVFDLVRIAHDSLN